MAEKYKVVDGKIIKVIEEDVTEQFRGQLEHFNQVYEGLLLRVNRREQLKKAIEAYQKEIDKLEEEINAALGGLDREIIKQLEPEKAEKLGF